MREEKILRLFVKRCIKRFYFYWFNKILSHTIIQGDTVTVKKNSTATIFYSDGSQSTLGDTTQDSKLIFAKMQFPGEDNLITKIALALESGTIWTKATSLNSEGSEFDIYTQDTSASVRGTIFGVQSINNNTKINTIEGKVKIFKIEKYENISDLVEKIKNNKIEKKGNPKVSTPEVNSNTDLIKNFSPPFSTNISLDNLELNFGEEAEESGVNTEVISFTTKAKNYTNLVLEIEHNKKLYSKTGSILYIQNFTYNKESPETITLTTGSNFNKISGEKIKNKNNSFVLKINDKGNTDTTLKSLLLSDNNKNAEVKIYLCSEKNKKLKCAGKTTFKLKDGKLVTTDREEKEELNFLPDDIANLKAKEDKSVDCASYPEITEYTKEQIKEEIICTCKTGTSLITIGDNRYCEANYEGKKLYAFAPYDNQGINITNINSKFLKLYGKNDGITATSFFQDWARNQISSVVKSDGVFIDNGNDDDFIKYSGLNLSKDFVIEMSVSKQGLKQSGGRYIFDTKNTGKGLFIFYFGNDEFRLIYNSKEICNDKSELNNCNLNFTSSFEKIIVNNKTGKLNIGGKEFSIKKQNINDLFIGGRNDKQGQFNGVIDYVKIYK